MARLNKTEKLIQQTAKSGEPSDVKLYGIFLDFFKRLKYYNKDENIDIITYLYTVNHEGKTFLCIAKKLHISLSKLEKRRKQFQKVFLSIKDDLAENKTAAA